MSEFFCDNGTVSYPGCSRYTNDTWNKIVHAVAADRCLVVSDSLQPRGL